MIRDYNQDVRANTGVESGLLMVMKSLVTAFLLKPTSQTGSSLTIINEEDFFASLSKTNVI